MDKKLIRLIDTTLRDGAHAVKHQYTAEQIKKIAGGLDKAKIDYIEVCHGEGLAGDSLVYGRPAITDEEMISAAASAIENSKLTVLLVPGLSTSKDIEMAKNNGAKAIRVCTLCTEVNISLQHVKIAKDLGLEVFGFMMMIHILPVKDLVEYAKLFESYGIDYLNLADSAGSLLPDQVKDRIGAVVNAVDVPVDFHAHNNLGLAIGNSLAALDAGASMLDGTCRGLGAGSGNTQIEVLAGVLKKAGYEANVDFYKLMDVAEDIVQPIIPRPQVIDNAGLMIGYAGIYSSFLLHVYEASKKFNLDPREIIVELGNRKMVGGQEDLIIDVAYQLTKAK